MKDPANTAGSVDAGAVNLEEGSEVQRRLRESEQLYRQLAENVHDVIWTIDARTWRYTYISPSIKRLRGLSVEEALAEPLEQSLTPESFAKVQARNASLGTAGGLGPPQDEGSITDVYDQPCKDGSVRHVEIRTTPVVDDQGLLVGVLGVSRDVTARVEAERAQQRTLEELRRALAEVKRLSGLIPMCSYCKSVRNDAGYWAAVEEYLLERSEATISHGICPKCMAQHFPEEG
jgi:PAS domain S-box-containing protein